MGGIGFLACLAIMFGSRGYSMDPQTAQALDEMSRMAVLVGPVSLCVLVVIVFLVTWLTGGLKGGPYRPSCGDF
jgi:hypothetical protein